MAYSSKPIFCSSGKPIFCGDKGTTSAISSQRATSNYRRFRLSHHSILLPNYQVLEATIVPAASIVPVANMPPTMLGQTNYQNQILWVTDLAQLVGLSVGNGEFYQLCHLIVLQFAHLLMGLRVHAIGEVLTISPNQLQAIPSYVPKELAPFLKGCLQQNAEVLFVLNAQTVLQAPILRPR